MWKECYQKVTCCLKLTSCMATKWWEKLRNWSENVCLPLNGYSGDQEHHQIVECDIGIPLPYDDQQLHLLYHPELHSNVFPLYDYQWLLRKNLKNNTRHWIAIFSISFSKNLRKDVETCLSRKCQVDHQQNVRRKGTAFETH